MVNHAVIVAGGAGSRMKTDKPKQFLELIGRPILMHTLDAFHDCDLDIEIILVLPAHHIPIWQELIVEHGFKTPHRITSGGHTRFDSVKSGLNQIDGDGIVAIHDGARPLVTSDIIYRTVVQAKNGGNGIAAVPIKDSIRQVQGGQNKSVDRNHFYVIQTPQTFKAGLIKYAFAVSGPRTFTDDASVVEAYGEKIELVEGSYDNLKITTPEDLAVAAAILAKRK